jgi:integrase
MADPVAVVLDRLSEAQGEPADDDLVFPDPRTGEPMTKWGVTRRFQRALEAAGLEERRFHDLRHTFGTQMAAVGTPMRTLQEWMGHRDMQTTQRYADYAPSTREAEFIKAAFSGDGARGTNPGTDLSEPERTSDHLNGPAVPSST